MIQKDVAIVGAGASGLLCAIVCASAGFSVTLYEQNTKPAKKILVSGNGRCNISNKNLSYRDYFSQKNSFVSYALKEFGFEKFEKFCLELGLVLNTLEDGRAYPLSNEAKSVARIFEQKARSLGVTFHNNVKITDIQKLLHEYKNVVVATGSRAAEHLGGNSDGEEFAKLFHHTIIPAYPSLVQLHLNSKLAPKMSGNKISGEVTLYLNGVKDISTHGDILFTNYGVSGFAILDISQSVSQALLEYQAVDISLNLLPKFTMQQLSLHILSFTNTLSDFSLLDILSGLIPQKIATALLEELSLDATQKVKTLTPKLSKKIANKMLHWKFEVSDTHGFRHAEVSGGGIDISEINEKTFESYKCKNLYFCGEVLDVLGKRGGYNFAFAWASAYLAAQDIIKKL